MSASRVSSLVLPMAFLLPVCPAPAAPPNDVDFVRQWGLHNVGQEIGGGVGSGLPGADIKAVEAWDYFGGARNVAVAIVGRGIDPHADLAGRLLEGTSVVGDPYDTLDSCPHDTHLAGIVAAIRNNALGIAGIHDGAAILPVRVLDGCGGTAQDAAAGIRYAVDAGAAVILAAVRFSEANAELEAAIAYAASADVLVVAPSRSAADSVVAYPAAYAGCMAVSATDLADGWSPDSSFGVAVEISAPGRGIWSTWTGEGYGFQPAGRDTASAAAFVAGAAALLRSFNPGLSAAEVRDLLVDNADDLGAPGWDSFFGHGRLNARDALLAAPVPGVRIEPLFAWPTVLPPGVSGALPIRLVTDGTPIASAELVYTAGIAGSGSVPLVAGPGDVWTLRFPALSCGEEVSYHVSVSLSDGEVIRYPPQGVGGLPARVGSFVEVFADDFEADRDWLVEGGDNSSGMWDRIEPVGTSGQPGYDRSVNAGRFCLMTGQHFGGHDGTNDVDGGPWLVTSPVIEVDGHSAEVSYHYWMHWGGQGAEDFLDVEVSGGGSGWVPALRHGSGDAWRPAAFRVEEVLGGPVESFQVRFVASDDPNDSLTEAGVDEFSVTVERCAAVPGDYDLDDVVGLEDVGALIACGLSPGVTVSGRCGLFDVNSDFRVDLRDVQGIQQAFAP